METTVAILMADLSGYTAMTEVHGGASAAHLIRRYLELVRESLHGDAAMIQRVGDQVVIVSNDADDIVVTAKNLIAKANNHHFLSLHAGIHFGPVIKENGNLFGTTINVAARIMSLARQGQVLCSQALFEQIKNLKPFEFGFLGTFHLKHVLHTVEIFKLEMEHHHQQLAIDPVCQMQIDPGQSDIMVQHHGKLYHFCSAQCAVLFQHQPSAFIAGHVMSHPKPNLV